MKLIGLTGGIGMGKSAAAHWLRERGVPVVDTDLLAHQVVEPGQPALEEIRRTFGTEVAPTGGSLHREALARIVFSDAAARESLEAILHPRIRKLWMDQAASWRAEGIPLAVVIIPLLFETGSEKQFDLTVCVACSAGTQRRRLEERGWTPEQMAQRIAAQWPVERKIAKSDMVIWTEGGLDVLAAQLERMLESATSKYYGLESPSPP